MSWPHAVELKDLNPIDITRYGIAPSFRTSHIPGVSRVSGNRGSRSSPQSTTDVLLLTRPRSSASRSVRIACYVGLRLDLPTTAWRSTPLVVA